ncbi:MAG: hypothetical protein ACRDJE_04165, partial [Dehalococcoidia bacterium]
PIEAVAGADALGVLAYIPGGWFVPLTMLLTGIMLYRTRTVPILLAALLAASGLLFPIARMPRIDSLALASDALLIIALVPIGVAMIADARRARLEASTSQPTTAGLTAPAVR